ncbi:N-6 DNA methylase [Lentzea aerocolonigenes]|uniref:N-6 DNA methylase n=1 Tax=Lentzea aerocolonigenes TaxID=68170 RepID=UPI000698C4D6|nr:N-6 DNA methylase [Lentzea aerocolonigenes]
MKPLTAAELTKYLIDADRIIGLTHVRTGRLDILSAILLLKWASDQPGRLDVPEHARWSAIAEGNYRPSETLTKALASLVDANDEVLERLFWKIDFTNSLSEHQTMDLIGHFSRISLRAEELQFHDTVATAFDALLDETADAAGKKGGEFRTPRSVIDLMVRLARPKPGQSVCDPFAGSGGMLAGAEKFATERSGKHGTLKLFAQDLNIAQCRTTQLNLLLHDAFRPAIRNGDTLTNPLHLTADGSWQRFDRVLANPPFSVGYQSRDVRFPERMRYGWTPETGKRADLMFVQHVLASLTQDGVGVVVSPQGVLFRAGAEGEIRRGIVSDGRLAAVIGIGPNVFYGTGIPACVLVLTGNAGSLPGRRGVFFINAEHEISTGRSLNHLDPRHVEKITDVFHERREIPHFSRFVSISEIADNNFNLNVRRYISQPPAVQTKLDTQALVTGGVPRAEIEAQRGRFNAFGIDLLDLFQPGEWGTMEFLRHGLPTVADRVLEKASHRENTFLRELDLWLTDEVRGLVGNDHTLPVLRDNLIRSFHRAMAPLRILDEFQLSGLFADWWAARYDDLREIVRSDGRLAIIDKLQADLNDRAKRLTAKQRQDMMNIYRTWVAQYGTSLAELDEDRARSAAKLREKLADLGVPWPESHNRW